MKTCSKCKKEKNIDSFSKNTKRYDGLQSFCKQCAAEHAKHLYKTTDRKKKIAERNKENRARNRRFLWEYLKTHPCIDCGESDPTVLEFDHQRDKASNLSDMSRNGFSIEKIVEEIHKCVIRCANCHRRKTAEDFQWYKDCE